MERLLGCEDKKEREGRASRGARRQGSWIALEPFSLQLARARTPLGKPRGEVAGGNAPPKTNLQKCGSNQPPPWEAKGVARAELRGRRGESPPETWRRKTFRKSPLGKPRGVAMENGRSTGGSPRRPECRHVLASSVDQKKIKRSTGGSPRRPDFHKRFLTYFSLSRVGVAENTMGGTKLSPDTQESEKWHKRAADDGLCFFALLGIEG